MSLALIKNLGLLLCAWAFITVLFNPFLESRFRRNAAIGLAIMGSLIVVVAHSAGAA